MASFSPPPKRSAVTLSAGIPEGGGNTVTGQVTLKIAGDTVTVEVTAPADAVPLEDVLPVFHGLANAICDLGEQREADQGRQVSCRAGCGACCRQAVPISPSEARALARLVDGMPEPRRSIIRHRFATARAKLAQGGIDTRPEGILGKARTEVRSFGLEYFAQKVACPFLEAESCSIHLERPTSCREYLVTSPAENCATPTLETVRGVPLPGHVSLAVLAIDQALEGHGSLILVDALDFVAKHPVATEVRPGPAIIQAVFAKLAEQKSEL